MNKNSRVLAPTILALAVSTLCVNKVVAEGGSILLEEIVVTAQKREQSIQDVPISISAFSGEQLIEAGIVDVQDLEALSPSLSISSSTDESRSASLRIRGVGTTGNNTGLEGAVGVFVDGVYLSRSGIAMNDLMDIDSVEVLRGPQGTLFGKNTSSGAIVISTRRPEFDFGGSLSASYGNDNALKVKGSVTGELLEDKLAGRLAFTTHTRDGQVDDVNTGEEYNDKDRWAVRGQLFFMPSSNVSVRVIADYGEKDENCCASPYSLYGVRQDSIVALGGTTASLDPFDRKVAIDGGHRNSTEEYGLSAELEWDLGSMNLTSISSLRNYTYDILTDGDRSDIDIVDTEVSSEIDTVTQEVRLQGVSGIVDWMVGAYWFAEDISEQSSTLYGSQTGDYFATFTPNPGAQALIRSSYVEGEGALLNGFEQETQGWSVFTHNNVSLAEALSLTIGLRYNIEDKEGDGTFISQSTALCSNPGPLAALGFICPVPDFASDNDYEELTGTLKLSYSFEGDAMIYGGYSRGFKAGGINLNRNAGLSIFEFLPETVDAWEIGMKSELFERRVRLNASAYYSEFDDFQLNTFDGVTTVVSNAAGVRSRGIELDVMAMLQQHLIIMGGYAYNDAEYTGDTVAGLAGEQLSNAPRSTVTAGIVYTYPLTTSGLVGFFNTNARYQSGYNTVSDLNPVKYQSDFTVVNTRIGLRDDNAGWELALWGKNISDEEYVAVIIDSPGQAGSYNAFVGPPATFGMSATLEF